MRISSRLVRVDFISKVEVNMIIGCAMNIAIYFLLAETRGSKILDDRAGRLTIQTGVPHIADAGGSSEPQKSVIELIRMTASRPIVFLTTEPIVAAIATWAALLSVVQVGTLLCALIPDQLTQVGSDIPPFFSRSSRLRTIRIFLGRDGKHIYHYDGWRVLWRVRS